MRATHRKRLKRAQVGKIKTKVNHHFGLEAEVEHFGIALYFQWRLEPQGLGADTIEWQPETAACFRNPNQMCTFHTASLALRQMAQCSLCHLGSGLNS